MKRIQEKELRNVARLTAYHLVKYRPLERKQAVFVLSTIRDIGSGGACLRTQEHLSVSTLLELKFNFPGFEAPIPTLAKVIWVKQVGRSRRYDLGVQFIEIEEFARQFIDEQVKLVQNKLDKV